jgi:NodT family efflux transporter outer membrane factor (OMF) lipoprotein
VQLEASWAPDLFGQVANTVSNAKATEQARLADLANARLALQGELATDYLSLRAADAQIESLTQTVTAYQRSLQITTNQYNAGIAPHSDVYQAQSQLASAQSDLEGEKQTRAQFEDAIAVLVGENPATFTLPSIGTAWNPVVPDVPVALPSTVLQRRPDIASAERQVAAANAEIGVEKAAFFPTVNLSADGGFNNNSIAGLFTSAASLWSVGAQVAETLIDFGARSARVKQARAAYDAQVANYRQVTLTAFQDVQDNLVAAVVLAKQEAFLRQASIAADKSEVSLLDQYKAGTVAYTDVVTAQATALSARRSLIQAEVDRQNAAVALVQALGGGWQAADIVNGAEAARAGDMHRAPQP